jgi:O-acetyl-ADP-ribose deacetylase (regulator of RNase III)
VTRIRLEEGDISAAQVDAIVNAANTRLILGSGVARAIRERGGSEIQRECDAHGPIGLGGVALTGAGQLPARYVIHAAGMEPGGQVSEEALRACTRAALELAEGRGLRTLAFPAIGTGVGGLSVRRCAEVMLAEVRAHVARGSRLEEVRFVLFGEPAYRVFEQVDDAEKVRLQTEKLGR